MRIAVLGDIHGNLSALEAVLADLRDQAPDEVIHLGDLAASGCHAAQAVDTVRDRGWRGVMGNTDEMLWRPELKDAFIARTPALESLWRFVFDESAPATAEALGPERLAWLQTLPMTLTAHGIGLVHASPDDLWKSPLAGAADSEFRSVYGRLGTPVVVYGHIHAPFVRAMGDLTVANTGSVGLPYDGDPRASYLIVDDGNCWVRRVEYDIEREIRALAQSGHPRAGWIADRLRDARYAPLE